MTMNFISEGYFFYYTFFWLIEFLLLKEAWEWNSRLSHSASSQEHT